MRVPHLGVSVLGALAALAVGCVEEPFPSSDELDLIRGLYKVRTLPGDPTNRWADDPKAAALGERLFTDPGLSRCGNVACSNCHPAPTFATAQRYAVGCDGRTVSRNAPTLLNVGFRRWLYWDGQKDSLWAHPALPLSRETEMDTTKEAVRERLQAKYRLEYAELFGQEPDEHTPERAVANVGKAIAAYLRTLVFVDAPFDDQLQEFITAAEADIASGQDVRVRALPIYLGLKVFVRKGRCHICHKGPNLTDDRFHNLGVDEEGREDRGREAGIELVLADIYRGDGEYSDAPEVGKPKLQSIDALLPPEGALGSFKTPSLRNVALSAPYLHTGRLNTLEDVVRFYESGGDRAGTFLGKRAETLVPFTLTPEERQALVKLLESLTDKRLQP